MHVSMERCTGCQGCMLACSLAKEGTHSLSLSRIQIARNEDVADFRPRVCVQCEQRACIAACPVGALRVHDQTGAVLLDSATCVGCGACGSVCPYGGVRFDVRRNRPLICDLCGGAPACVDACRFPTAIMLVEEDLS